MVHNLAHEPHTVLRDKGLLQLLPCCHRDLVNPPAQSPDSPSIPVSPNEAYRPRVLTVLLPTEKALDAYLASKKTNLDTLLANKTAVNNFVEAHVVSGHRLRLMNLMDLALVYGSNEPVKGHYTSKCGPLVTIGGQKYDVSVSTNLLDVWVLPAGSSKIKAKVTTGITPGVSREERQSNGRVRCQASTDRCMVPDCALTACSCSCKPSLDLAL